MLRITSGVQGEDDGLKRLDDQIWKTFLGHGGVQWVGNFDSLSSSLTSAGDNAAEEEEEESR